MKHKTKAFSPFFNTFFLIKKADQAKQKADEKFHNSKIL